KITPTFFIQHYLRGGKFIDNCIISFKYNGPLNNPDKNFKYWLELLKCKFKLLTLIIKDCFK
ncbi:hypothetical protein N9713_05680, partial [Candidatus Pelagibacter sp.]|nr:hypothetical protein [Candidatus Pelagibacter sp.]